MRPRSRAPQSSTAVTRPRSRATPIQPYCQLTQPLTGRQAHYTRRERQCVHGIAPNNPSPYGIDAGHTENIRRNCSPTTINESPMKTAFSHARKLNSEHFQPREGRGRFLGNDDVMPHPLSSHDRSPSRTWDGRFHAGGRPRQAQNRLGWAWWCNVHSSRCCKNCKETNSYGSDLVHTKDPDRVESTSLLYYTVSCRVSISSPGRVGGGSWEMMVL